MPAVSFIQFFFSFFLHLFIKRIINKLQPLPCKVSKTFSVGCGDYLIILVQDGASISYACLFKIHGTVP